MKFSDFFKKQPSGKYSKEWVQNLSDNDLNKEWDIFMYGLKGLTPDKKRTNEPAGYTPEKTRIHDLLKSEMDRRYHQKWDGSSTKEKRHREHGDYLPNDD